MGVSGLAASAGASAGRHVDAGTLANVVSIASDNPNGGFCALLSTGHVDCWGYNGDGELGNGTTTDSDVPVAAIGITDATAVTSSSDGTSFCALLSTGQVKCWGFNNYGELGNGTTTGSDVPVAVKNISTATAVIGGIDGFCSLLSTKHIDCWGRGRIGQLGNGTMTSSDVPVAVHKITNAVTLIGGVYSFCALLATGHLNCWGYGVDGELGNGTFSSSDVPVAVTGITDARAIVGDSEFGDYCALLSTGKVRCWGYGGDGELGNGTTTDSDVPVAAIGITDATAVTSTIGGRTNCALLTTNKLKCWGLNEFGELGNGTTANDSDVPVSVKNIGTATAVIGGYFRFCALLTTSHLDCWGSNSDGELGNGTTTDSDVPVAVHKITNAATLIGGFSDFCALLATSHVDCWGLNEDGELGDGTFNNSDVPVAVHAAS